MLESEKDDKEAKAVKMSRLMECKTHHNFLSLFGTVVLGTSLPFDGRKTHK